MFKRFIVTSIALAVACGTASAYQCRTKMSSSCPSFKNCTPIYCKFDPATYFGLSLGIRNNYSNDPANFTGLDFSNLSLGYGGIVSSNFYFATELFALGTISLTNNSIFGTGAATTWGVGASILPGFAVTRDAIIYTRLGPILSHFSDQSQNKIGWQVGLGSEVDICPNFGLRSEYVYTWYGNVSGMSNVQSNAFSMGIVYRFM